MGITNKCRWKNCLQTTIKLCVCTEDNIVCGGSVQRGERSRYGMVKCVAGVRCWNSGATNHYFPLELTIQSFISSECSCYLETAPTSCRVSVCHTGLQALLFAAQPAAPQFHLELKAAGDIGY